MRHLRKQIYYDVFERRRHRNGFEMAFKGFENETWVFLETQILLSPLFPEIISLVLAEDSLSAAVAKTLARPRENHIYPVKAHTCTRKQY
jgi:hypothetical protein